MGATSSEGDEMTEKINEELWYACAGPLASLPAKGSLVLYFPQGHSEQVSASMPRNSDAQIPSCPNLPWKLVCLLHSVSLRADPDTDDVFAQMTLQPLNSASDEGVAAASDPGYKPETLETEFFCKTLTASDTSTHGGFSVPRRAAENVFPRLDYSMQPPAQELRARDLHGNLWTFRHIYRGQPKRHLLTTGWSTFVTGKRLVAGDSVLFIRNGKKEKELLLGIRRAYRQPSNISSSGLSSESIQIGILAAAAHAYATRSRFTVFYNPRASSSPFVIPLAKYKKAVYSHCVDLGTRFRMILEAEDSGKRSHTGTITGIGDLDPVRWNSSRWRNLQVEWDEPVPTERRERVSVWEIEPVQEPFSICSPPLQEMESLLKRAAPWLGNEISFDDSGSRHAVLPVGPGSSKKMNVQNQNPSSRSPILLQRQDPQFQPQFQAQRPLLQSQFNPQELPTQQQIQGWEAPRPQSLLEHPTSLQIQRVLEQQTMIHEETRQPVLGTASIPQQPSANPLPGLANSLPDGTFCFSSTSSALPRTVSGYFEDLAAAACRAESYPKISHSLQHAHANSSTRMGFPSSSSSASLSPADAQQLYPSPSSPFCRERPDPGNSVVFGVALDNLLDPLLSEAAADSCPGKESGDDRLLPSTTGIARDLDASASFAQSLGAAVSDITAFDSSPLTRASSSWTPPRSAAPQRRRTYTKVYKRGAVGRSIDVARYSGYEKLKRDLARMFSIEGQLEEDREKRGWKLVYVDHENDVLLVGDDPWEEFVNCVRCIKILSPQEVEQMSLDGGEATAAPPFVL